MENIIVNYLKSPYDLHGETPEWLPSAGMAGYFAGYLGLFAYMRLGSSVMPGVFSCIALILIMLASDMLSVAIIHLFVSLSGKKGNASALFYLFGCSCFLFMLCLPIGLIAMLSKAFAGLAILALCAAMFVLRVKMLRRAYENISIGRSILAMFIPNLLVQSMICLSLIYTIVNGIWLVKMSV